MKNMTTQKDRLKALALYLEVSVGKLAALCNVSTATFYHITDKSDYKMSERTATRMCYFLEKKTGVAVNRDWLLNGTGEMLKQELSVPVKDNVISIAAESTPIYNNSNLRDKYVELLEKYTELQQKYTELLERQK